MTVLRREDVQSRVASWDGRPYRIASSPILAIVPLIIRRLRGPSLTRVMVSFTYIDGGGHRVGGLLSRSFAVPPLTYRPAVRGEASSLELE